MKATTIPGHAEANPALRWRPGDGVITLQDEFCAWVRSESHDKLGVTDRRTAPPRRGAAIAGPGSRKSIAQTTGSVKNENASTRLDQDEIGKAGGRDPSRTIAARSFRCFRIRRTYSNSVGAAFDLMT